MSKPIRGRLIRSREENGSNAVQRTEHLYDSANRLTAQNWSIGSSGFSEQYGYSSVDGTMITFDITSTLPNDNSDTFHLNYDYDKLNQMEKASFSYSDETTPIYTRSYTYLNYTGSSTRTTSRLGTY